MFPQVVVSVCSVWSPMNKVISHLPVVPFQIFDLLPVKETTYVPYELEDPVACLRVRPRRSIIPHPYGPSEQTNDPYAAFQVNISALFSQLEASSFWEESVTILLQCVKLNRMTN